jgi:hypothetical protein
MFGILGEIKQFISQIMEFGWWLAIGGGIAVLAAMFRTLLGFVGVAIGGAAIMFLALTTGWLADDSDKIKRLEAQVRDAEIAIDIAEAGRKIAEADLLAEIEIAEHNEGVINTLRQHLDQVEDKPDCGIDKEFFDDLDQLR